MCGIFGYIGKSDNAKEIILQGLKALEYRGYDSWGIALIPQLKDKTKKQRIVIKKETGKIGKATVNELPKANLGFGHTRWATHGGVTKINAHPHLDCNKKIAIIHNGIIENYAQLKQRLIKKGHRFISATDSEVLAHLIEEHAQDNSFLKAVTISFKKLKGLNAVIAINCEEQTLICAKNGSPLVIGFSKQENFLSSDPSALLPYTRQVYFLKDDEIAKIEKDKVEVFNHQGKRKKITKTKLTLDDQETVKGRYPHFMLKEIYQQPQVIEKIAKNKQKDILNFTRMIKKSFGTYMVGCGTAAYACLSGTYLFSKIAKFHINYAIGSEFSYQLDFLTNKSLVIALSQSGETMDTLQAVKKAREKKAKIAALVNVEGSTLYREADYSWLLQAGVEKGVASTKAFTAKLASLILLAYSLAKKQNQGKEILIQAEKSSKQLLIGKSINKIKTLAAKIKNSKNIYVLGRGLSYPASLETALKIKEISYIHAEGLPAGELKHGPLALIEKNTPAIVFLPQDETYGANLAAAMEVKARGGYIIGVSFKTHEIFDYFIKVNNCQEATIIPNVIFGQLLAYYLSINKGYDPDKPRNLAKSVTVK